MRRSRFRAFRLALFLLAGGGCTLSARAADPSLSVGAVAGYGDRTNTYGVQLVWVPRPAIERLERHDLDLRFSAQVARWIARADPTGHGSLTDGSVTSELRYWLSPAAANRSFVEVGLGLHLLSHVQIAKRNLGIAFNLGTQVAAGFTFGEQGRYELAALISHVSNAGLQYPNDGFTYGAIRFRVALP